MKVQAKAQFSGFPPGRCNCLFWGAPIQGGGEVKLQKRQCCSGGEKNPEEDRYLQSALLWRQDPGV